MNKLKLVILLGLVVPLSLFARIETHEFDTPEQEALFVQLTKELRCLVCQNQNLADSNADLAKDLRDKTYEMVKQGKSHAEITEYMIARYGDFVMYRPPVKSSTFLLWLGPFGFLVAALVGLIFFLRRRSADDDTPSREEMEAARKVLDKDKS